MDPVPAHAGPQGITVLKALDCENGKTVIPLPCFKMFGVFGVFCVGAFRLLVQGNRPISATRDYILGIVLSNLGMSSHSKISIPTTSTPSLKPKLSTLALERNKGPRVTTAAFLY